METVSQNQPEPSPELIEMGIGRNYAHNYQRVITKMLDSAPESLIDECFGNRLNAAITRIAVQGHVNRCEKLLLERGLTSVTITDYDFPISRPQ